MSIYIFVKFFYYMVVDIGLFFFDFGDRWFCWNVVCREVFNSFLVLGNKFMLEEMEYLM